MKTTLSCLLVGLYPLVAGVAGAIPVTFQVDMSGNPGFEPWDVVDVRGTFNNWAGGDNPGAGGIYLIPSANPYILTNTIDIGDPVGTVEYYKFTWNYGFELYGLGNRFFTLQNGPQTVPLVYFNDQPPAVSATTNSITFRVSMANQVAAGNFDPVNDTVSVAGLFQSPYPWSPDVFFLTNSGLNDLYIGTYPNDGNYPGTYEEYKFVFNHNGYDNWESIGNRFLLLTNHEILPVVYFNNQGTPVPVTFQLDLGVEAAAGRFDPNVDIVECKGTFNGWQGGFQLTNNPTGPDPDRFTGTTYVFDSPGTVENYKFTVDGGYLGLGWESPASAGTLNRSFTQTANAQTLPVVWWSDWTAADVLPAGTWVTFQVNMAGAVGSDQTLFQPFVNQVYLNGDWMPWWSWGYPSVLPMDPDQNGVIYSTTVYFPAGYSVPLTYKYSIDGNDNEAAFSTNRLRYIRTTGNYTLPLDTFGNQLHEASFGDLKIGHPTGGRALISWLGRPGVQLQTTTNLAGTAAWQSLPATDGTAQTNYLISPGTRYFRLIKP